MRSCVNYKGPEGRGSQFNNFITLLIRKLYTCDHASFVRVLKGGLNLITVLYY